MKKSVRIIIGVIVGIIILAVLILGIREFILNKDESLDKSNEMTRDEIVELLKKGASYKNFYYCPDYEENELKTEYYIKDNMVVCYVDGELRSYTNYNTKEMITVLNNNSIVFSNNAKDNSTSQYGYDYSLVLEDFGWEYEYLGEMQENDRTMIVIKMKNGKSYVKFYIDKDTGLIFRRKDVNKGIITIYSHVSNRNVKLDIVTSEQVQPDFSSYAVMNK